jgi:hypothetical protein
MRAKPGPPMTLANMRENGVHALIATREACGRSADVNVDALPETVTVPEAGQRFKRVSSSESLRLTVEIGMRSYREAADRFPASAIATITDAQAARPLETDQYASANAGGITPGWRPREPPKQAFQPFSRNTASFPARGNT